jgi:oligo-1,6-glucosidase
VTNWKEKVIYQIWPRSFNDSNGDGIGDLVGIIEKLDYLKRLGIDLIWLSPVYLSSNKDYGYDIDDYYHINPEFGTMEDFDKLLEEAKLRGIGIIMDLVANHTSDQHEWFKKALDDPSSPYRDYYFFRKGKEGSPPNNWMSFFGGSSWTYDAKSKEYYLTQFTPNQCDLNWENVNMRQGIYDIMRFWLDKGIAGFRMDVINAISKDEELRDKDPDKKGLQFPAELTLNRPKTHTYLQEMNREVLSKYDCITIGEGALAGQEDVVRYTHPDSKELQMMFHFDLHMLGCGSLGRYDFRKLYRWRILDFKKVLISWQTEMQKQGGWIGSYLSNHDQRRQVSLFGDDKKFRRESAKALCLLNFTLRGTPFIYQGEEIGMVDCPLRQHEWRDYEAINAYEVLQQMMHVPAFIARSIIKKANRDNARTPMQWNAMKNAGFTTGKPWIKVNPNYMQLNAEDDEKHPESILTFYRDTIAFRKKHPVLTWGSFTSLCDAHKKAVVYIREDNKEKLFVLINMSNNHTKINFKNTNIKAPRLIYSTHKEERPFEEIMKLAPFEGRVYELN